MFVPWTGGGGEGFWLGSMFCGLVSDETINWLVIVALWITEQMSLRLWDWDCVICIYSEHYFASVTCGSFHLNQTSKCVLANKGIELNIVFSLTVDALIFYLWILNSVERQERLSKSFIYDESFDSPKVPTWKGTKQNNIWGGWNVQKCEDSTWSQQPNDIWGSCMYHCFLLNAQYSKNGLPV